MIALAVCAGVVAWWAVQIAAPRPAIAPAVQPSLTLPDPSAAASLFGAAGAGPKAAAEVRLASVKVLGVVVHPQRGAALLGVDGAAPRAYAVGEQVSNGLSLIEVTPDSAIFLRFGERIELAAPRRATPELLQSGPASGTSDLTPPANAAKPAPRPATR